MSSLDDPAMIRFTCLGSVDLVGRNGAPVVEVLAQPKRVALLTYVALFNHGGFVPRDLLLEVFWPESDTDHARNSLNQALHRLRSALGPEALETRGKHEIRLSRDAVWCDALAFRSALEAGRAGEATELYGGDLLEGLHASSGGGFQRWLDGERAKLRRQFCDAAWRRAEEAEAAGNLGTAIELAREAVSKAPFDEVALRRLMELLVRVGDRAEALRAYELFGTRLVEELGVEPDPATEALAEALRANEALAFQAAMPSTPPDATPPGSHPASPASRASESPPSLESPPPRARWSIIAVAVAAFVLMVFALASSREASEGATEIGGQGVMGPDSRAGALPLPRQILWVDDNPGGNTAEIAHLEGEGVSVATATSTDAGIAMYDPTLSPVVLSDMGRYEGPGGEYVPWAGFELLDRLKALDPDVQVVFYTSSTAATNLHEAAADSGAVGITAVTEELWRIIGL
jgi:DNA-binding SARP family transcriptional activator